MLIQISVYVCNIMYCTVCCVHHQTPLTLCTGEGLVSGTIRSGVERCGVFERRRTRAGPTAGQPSATIRSSLSLGKHRQPLPLWCWGAVPHQPQHTHTACFLLLVGCGKVCSVERRGTRAGPTAGQPVLPSNQACLWVSTGSWVLVWEPSCTVCILLWP